MARSGGGCLGGVKAAAAGPRTAGSGGRSFYVIARGSAYESAAALSLLHADEALTDADYATASDLALRTMQMLTKLCQKTARSADSSS